MYSNFLDELRKVNPKKYRRSHFRGRSVNILGKLPMFDSKDASFILDFSYKLRTLLVFSAIVVIVTLTFFARLFSLQIVAGDEYSDASRDNRIRVVSTPAERGVIYDKNGDVIARNRPAFRVELNTKLCSTDSSDSKSCIAQLDSVGSFININKADLIKKIEDGASLIVLVDGLKKEDILALEANITKTPAVHVAISPKRDYTSAEAFSHLIGYVGLGETLYPTIVGKSGIELSYNDILTGIDGKQIVQVNSVGDYFDILAEQDPVPGKDIKLFVDSGLQVLAYELLKREVTSGIARAGAVVAQDPRTGGILALVSYPGYDSNKLVSGVTSQEYSSILNASGYPFYNRALSASYPPGSTFKMITASALLEEKTIDPQRTIFDPGYIQVGPYIYRNWKLDGHGNVDLLRAIQVSNDTYFYTVTGGHGDIGGLGITRLAKWAKLFGFGSPTGVDLPGEVSGFMPDGTGKEWYLGDTFISAIGQGDILATPLQVNNVNNYFASGGILFKPRVVDTILGSRILGLEEDSIKTRNIISTDTYNVVKTGLKMASSIGGTAYAVQDFSSTHIGIEVSGKTGTSEYIDSDGSLKTHAWYTSYAPYDNPTITLTVFLEGGGGGSTVAVPIARELYNYWFSDLSTQPYKDPLKESDNTIPLITEVSSIDR
ncbi:MAG: penicillin-binding protein 2 [Patescibacteria group bacterium]